MFLLYLRMHQRYMGFTVATGYCSVRIPNAKRIKDCIGTTKIPRREGRRLPVWGETFRFSSWKAKENFFLDKKFGVL
jgi:hypothetical protein